MVEEKLIKYHNKWWGWGNKDIRFVISNYPGLKKLMYKSLGIKELKERKNFDIEKIKIPFSYLTQEIINQFISELGQEVCSIFHYDRVIHSFGKSYKDLIRIRKFEIKSPPDIVLYPSKENHIIKIFELCKKNKIALIPFGGGSSVVGGLEILKGNQNYTAVLSMINFHKVLKIDEKSHIVEVEAGIFGPELEEILNKKGFTLGHFPQSFEFSTLGGWIATRSSGQNSIHHGGIEKLLVSLKLLSPTGEIKTITCPRKSTGPDFNEMVLGSEGIFGVITSATLKIKPLPSEKYYFMIALKNFKEASEIAKKFMQENLSLSMIRVSDEDETQAMLMMMSKDKKGFFSKVKKVSIKKLFSIKKLDINKISLMIIGIEGYKEDRKYKLKKIKKILKKYSHLNLGASTGKKWLKDRFFLPYLRDEMLDNNVLIDTLESATTWSNLENLYLSVKNSMLEVCKKIGVNAIVFTHISHLYKNGASLYFSIMANQIEGCQL